jgi:hypothetical protein
MSEHLKNRVASKQVEYPSRNWETKEAEKWSKNRQQVFASSSGLSPGVCIQLAQITFLAAAPAKLVALLGR